MMYRMKSSKRQLMQYLLVLPALILSVVMIGQEDRVNDMVPIVTGESIELDTLVVYNPNTYLEQIFVVKYLNGNPGFHNPVEIASGTGEFGKTGVTVKFGENKILRTYRIKSDDGSTDINTTTTQDEELVVRLPTGIYEIRIDEEGRELFTTFEVKE